MNHHISSPGKLPSDSGILPSDSGILSPGSSILPSDSGILSPGSGILSPGSGILSPDSGILSPGSGILSPGSGILPSDSGILSPGSGILSPAHTRSYGKAKMTKDREPFYKGYGVMYLPGDINGLTRKLHLLAAEFFAGNTTIRNGLIHVSDAVLRLKQLTRKEYAGITARLAASL